MASGGITGKAFSLEALFHGRVTYAIEYYQREYAWGPDEVSTLLADLVGEFERTSGSRLDDDAYRLPDDAAKTATGRKTCAGWKFWQVDLADGTAVPLGDFRDDPPSSSAS